MLYKSGLWVGCRGEFQTLQRFAVRHEKFPVLRRMNYSYPVSGGGVKAEQRAGSSSLDQKRKLAWSARFELP